MARTMRDLWNVRLTVYCVQCGCVDTGIYATLVHEDHWPLAHIGPLCEALCPHCVHTIPRLAYYPRGSWFLHP